MADFNFAPAKSSIAPQPGMSLGEMMNMATQAQALQQAQQMNPLQLQAAQQAVEQARQMNPMLLERQGAETAVSVGTQGSRINQAASEAETARIGTLKADYGLNAEQHKDFASILTGFRNDDRLKPENLATNPNGAVEVMHEISAEAKNKGIPDKKIAVLTAPGLSKALQDPKGFVPYFTNMIETGMSSSEKRALGLPEAVAGVAGQPPMMRDRITGALSAAPIINAPVEPVAPPAAGVTPQSMNQPPADEYSRPVPLPYPVRAPGQPYAPSPSEAIDLAAGQAYRGNLVSTQVGLSATRRNLDEVIKTVKELQQSNFPTSGFAGDVTRKISTFWGNTTYKQLSKDLANVQISNIVAMGGSLNTVAGQELTKKASGDETYPPDVLLNIAQRTYSDLTNIDMQATAIEKFYKKYGDNNVKAFQQMWSSNADSKIFEAINIADQVKDPQERKKALDLIMPKDQKERQIYLKKYQNIKKLVDTGSL
jgi:hypothetical protein